MKSRGRWAEWSRTLRRQSLVLYYAYRDPRTPWYAKAWAVIVVAYAFSPIDLIPDFIPVLGLLDDLVLIPLGIALAVRLIPRDVMDASRRKAQERSDLGKPTTWVAAGIIIAIWVVVASAVAWVIVKACRG